MFIDFFSQFLISEYNKKQRFIYNLYIINTWHL